jgi:hypothetical protein
MSALAKLESQWKAFKHDEPGQRFEHQRQRMKQEGRGLLVATTVIGSFLVAAGIVMLFIPGPGILVSIFGLALIAGVSERLARVMDRIEPAARRAGRRAKAWWSRASMGVKSAVITLAIASVGAATYGAYRMWFA